MNHQEQKLVHVSAGPVELEGNLSLPSNASGIVFFRMAVAAAGTARVIDSWRSNYSRQGWQRC